MKKIAGKPIRFARVGGLSPVVQKGYKKHRTGEASTHTPPAKHGIYAFVWPYIEPFLLSDEIGCPKWREGKGISQRWNEQSRKIIKLRKFDYEGPIWHHLHKTTDPRKIIAEKGNWIKTEFEDYVEALRKEFHSMRKDFIKFLNYDPKALELMTNNPAKTYCKDHLEVFIEDIH